MTLPPQLKQKLTERFDVLIAEGEEVIASMTKPNRDKVVAKTLEWGTKCASLLMQVLPRSHPRYADIPSYGIHAGCLVNPPYQLPQLKAIRDDFVGGFLHDLGAQIEAEIASDYMGQAEQLLSEGQTGKFDHVPAAVLSGAVLEKELRTLCSIQTPHIPTFKLDANGRREPLTMMPLIRALKRAGVFKQTVASQLETWAHIRNKAAHGEFDQFTRQEVQAMVSGVKHFIATYLP